MAGIRKKRCDGGIEHERPHFEIRVLRVPARNGCVVLREHGKGINPRGSRCVGVQVVFEDLLINCAYPRPEE